MFSCLSTYIFFGRIAELYEACRDKPASVGQNGRWWCPVPEPREGEELNHSQNNNHAVFTRIDHVRDHYFSQHFDYGVWEEGQHRELRTFGHSLLKCQKGCGVKTKTLAEMDKHLATSIKGCYAYDLHHVAIVVKVIYYMTLCAQHQAALAHRAALFVSLC